MPIESSAKDDSFSLTSYLARLTAADWMGCLLVFMLVGLFWEPAQVIWKAWTKEGGYYSHGPLVPAVVAWMVYSRKKELQSITWKPSWWGLPILVMCSLVFLASTLCHMYPPKYFTFVFYILGLNLLLFGSAMTRATIIPWAFLFFMVPLPDGLIDVITYKLRLIVTASAVGLTEPLDWYVVKSGNLIYFPDGDRLIVGDICAGLRSIISLLALGAVFAYLSNLSSLGSLILFLLSAPVAIVTNIMRIFALIVVAHYWGSRVASGKVHDISGWAIFVVAFALLYLSHLILERYFTVSSGPQQGEEQS